MTLQQRACPACGGPVASASSRCEHCGAWFEEGAAGHEPRTSISLGRFFAGLAPDVGEFGLSGALPLAIGLAVAVALYAAGWLLEDTRYWLAPGAVAIWGAALPIWLAMAAFLWRTRKAAWAAGAAIALIIFGIHLGIVWLIGRRINDDMLGIAAMYAALALAGWIVGRLGHLALRKRRTADRA